MQETLTTLVGNLAEAPELRITSSGVSVARFRMACTPRKRDGDKWVDGEASWYTVNIWRDLAEHVAESLKKGDQVIVYGALSVRQYEVEGVKRTSTEVEAYAVGASLQFANVTVTKAGKPSSGGARQSATDDGWGGAQPASQARPAATPAPAQAAANPADGW